MSDKHPKNKPSTDIQTALRQAREFPKSVLALLQKSFKGIQQHPIISLISIAAGFCVIPLCKYFAVSILGAWMIWISRQGEAPRTVAHHTPPEED